MKPIRQRRTFLCTERGAIECRLTPADVDFLLAGHRAHLELTPTGHRGRYRLTPTGHVGIIVAPTCRLVIRPKIPIADLFHLLDPTAPVPAIEDSAAAAPGTEGLNFLAGRLARLLAERVAAGLHRAYAERAEQGRFLQGRLDLPEQLRDPHGHKDQLHCRYQDFTADVPCNQVPKATAELVLRLPFLADPVRAALGRSLQAFSGIRSVPLGPEAFVAAEPDRTTETYRPLLDLCRLLSESLAPGEASGTAVCPAFLLDMEHVFERYVTQGVAGAFPEAGQYGVSVQPHHTANRPVPGQPDISLRPDLTVDRAGRPVLVVDAKWKGLAGSPLVTPDLYQVLAYCTALGVKRALLVYPGRHDREWVYALAREPVRLDIRTLRVSGSPEACARSLRRLRRAVRQAAVKHSG
jgi:5-methylcytosine-specific restriction enzyme subunit McrC